MAQNGLSCAFVSNYSLLLSLLQSVIIIRFCVGLFLLLHSHCWLGDRKDDPPVRSLSPTVSNSLHLDGEFVPCMAC